MSREEHSLGWVDESIGAAARAASAMRSARALLGALSLPSEGMLLPPPWVLHQRGESCTGHYCAQVIYALTGAKCSPYLPWYFARLRDGAEPQTAVPNVGVSMSAMKRALASHGACDFATWGPRSDGFSLGVAPPAIARLQAQRRNVSVGSIAERGATGLVAVIDALHRGLPVGVVVEVDDGFERATGGTVGPQSGESRGRHIITAWGWRTLGTGRRQIRIVNSWGTAWGVDGCAWLDEDRIKRAPALCVPTGGVS